MKAKVCCIFAVLFFLGWPPPVMAGNDDEAACQRLLIADVVALDQPFFWNRRGAAQANGMIYALKGDVVPLNTPTDAHGNDQTSGNAAKLKAGSVRLRSSKRARPMVLRLNVGDCLEVRFTNLLSPAPANSLQPTTRTAGCHIAGLELVEVTLPNGRVQPGISSDASWTGANPGKQGSFAAPGEMVIYKYYARDEGTFLITSIAGDQQGQLDAGLFGACHVEPEGAEYYRSQVTNTDMHLATYTVDDKMEIPANPQNMKLAPLFSDAAKQKKRVDPAGQEVYELTTITPGRRTVRTAEVVIQKDGHIYTESGHPLVNYQATYPPGHARAGLPILNMLQALLTAPPGIPTFQLVHSDLTAVITGPNATRFPYTSTGPQFNENPASPDRRQPYREFTIIYHDASNVVQAFSPYYDPNLSNALAAGDDSKAINYGTGGIGSEILANRLHVGPEGNPDAVDLKYEEFFLSSWALGDPAMVVDHPANAPSQVLTGPAEGTQVKEINGELVPLSPPEFTPLKPGPKATKAFYPDDPSNVYHSYMRDHCKFRILNSGPIQNHVHHLHAHQWLRSADSDDSSYLDSQLLLPGAGFTLEMVYNGSGNRNQTVGDSIFHCHFYPHFAQGMWCLWRVHDVFEWGTVLGKDGRPLPGWNRALPDGEIKAGTPIPGLVPMPSIAMAPIPAKVRLTSKADIPQMGENALPGRRTIVEPVGYKPDGEPIYANPGYPFFIPGVSGHRAPHPPMDFAWEEDELGKPKLDAYGNKKYLDGGLPRHLILDGEIFLERHTRWDFTKDFVLYSGEKVKGECGNLEREMVAGNLTAFHLPEEGTAVEKAAMLAHSIRTHATPLPDGDPGNFVLNGLPPVPGAPYADPSVNDYGDSTYNQRRYQAANVQTDVIFNKSGWHYPQQRFITLWGDVADTVSGKRPAQPFFFRASTGETIEFWHTNLVPNYYELDDFQVRTPTDILGQHIHLVKFDVTSSDGGGNGFNYEDGTLSPDEVRERIFAANQIGGLYEFDLRTQFKGDKQEKLTVTCYKDQYPFFGPSPPPFQDWNGAQTTIQRWDTDPLLNNKGDDRTLRTVFTHDHFGPSTHQQAGLYAGLLVEPENSTWLTMSPMGNVPAGTVMGSRSDGGPTNFMANIITVPESESYREFAFEFQDFTLAYSRTSRSTIGLPDPLFSVRARLSRSLNRGRVSPGLRNAFSKNGVTLGAATEVLVVVPGEQWLLTNVTKEYYLELKDRKIIEVFDLNPLFYTNDAFANSLDNGQVSDDLKAAFSRNGIVLGNHLKVEVQTPGRQWLILETLDPAHPDVVERYPVVRAVLFDMCEGLTTGTTCAELIAQLDTGDINQAGGVVTAFSNQGIALNTGNSNTNRDASIKVVTQGEDWRIVNPFNWMVSSPQNNDTYGVVNFQSGNTSLNVSALKIYTPDIHAGWSDPSFAIGNPSDSNNTVTGGPFPTLVSTGGVGTLSTNYRNEPLPLRVYDPTGNAAADNPALDLANAYRSMPRLDSDLNKQPAPGQLLDPAQPKGFRYPLWQLVPEGPLGVRPTDPYTPLLRAFENDKIQFRSLVGAHVNVHGFQVQGVNWLYEPDFNNSGYRNVQDMGISEHFEFVFDMPQATVSDTNPFADYVYAPSSGTPGLNNGVWGLLRGYDQFKVDPKEMELLPLPNNDKAKGTATPKVGFVKPPGAPVRQFSVTATTAGQALPGGALVYNARGQTKTETPLSFEPNSEVTDPNALIYVRTEDLDSNGKLKDGVPIEPLILRAAAGEWIEVTLINKFDTSQGAFSKTTAAQTPFGSPPLPTVNMQTSSRVGLHPQIVAYDQAVSNGMNVGFNPENTAAVDGTIKYQWYAGNYEIDKNGDIVAEPVEFGGISLAAAEPLVQHQFGMYAALIVEPEGATWTEDENTRAAATVTRKDGSTFREFAVVMSNETQIGSQVFNYRTETNSLRFANGAPSNGDYAPKYSNKLVQADPETPVFPANAGQEVLFQVIFAQGNSNFPQVFTVNGHVWQEEPYTDGSTKIGFNPKGQWIGGQQIVNNQSATLRLPTAGGAFKTPGDYLYRAFKEGAFFANGFWGIMRVSPQGKDATVINTAFNDSDGNLTIKGVNTVNPATGNFAATVNLNVVDSSGNVISGLGSVDVTADGTWLLEKENAGVSNDAIIQAVSADGGTYHAVMPFPSAASTGGAGGDGGSGSPQPEP